MIYMINFVYPEFHSPFLGGGALVFHPLQTSYVKAPLFQTAVLFLLITSSPLQSGKRSPVTKLGTRLERAFINEQNKSSPQCRHGVSELNPGFLGNAVKGKSSVSVHANLHSSFHLPQLESVSKASCFVASYPASSP